MPAEATTSSNGITSRPTRAARTPESAGSPAIPRAAAPTWNPMIVEAGSCAEAERGRADQGGEDGRGGQPHQDESGEAQPGGEVEPEQEGADEHPDHAPAGQRGRRDPVGDQAGEHPADRQSAPVGADAEAGRLGGDAAPLDEQGVRPPAGRRLDAGVDEEQDDAEPDGGRPGVDDPPTAHAPRPLSCEERGDRAVLLPLPLARGRGLGGGGLRTHLPLAAGEQEADPEQELARSHHDVAEPPRLAGVQHGHHDRRAGRGADAEAGVEPAQQARAVREGDVAVQPGVDGAAAEAGQDAGHDDRAPGGREREREQAGRGGERAQRQQHPDADPLDDPATGEAGRQVAADGGQEEGAEGVQRQPERLADRGPGDAEQAVRQPQADEADEDQHQQGQAGPARSGAVGCGRGGRVRIVRSVTRSGRDVHVHGHDRADRTLRASPRVSSALAAGRAAARLSFWDPLGCVR